MATIAQPTTLVAPVTKPASGLWSWITTVDHKRIGILYSVSALILFLTGGLEAMIIRLQLIRPNNGVVTAAHYNELFTMHGTTMIFLAIMPLSVGIANYVVPLQIGARDVAFPRLNAFSYWTFLAGAIILNMSWFFDKAPNQGWYGYAPLSDITWNPARNVDFWMFGLQVLGVASIAGGINFITTILNMRAPGMSMMRMPIFTWATFITQIMVVMAFPAVTIALILLSFDRYAGTGFFAYAAGGDPLLWQHLFWVFGHPEVYILVLPAFGIVSEIIPVFSRKPLFGYSVMVYALAAIAFLGFTVWAHHMFTTGLGPTANSAFAGATMLIAIPTGVKIFNWLGTMFRGSLKFTTPMLFAVGLVSQFTIGGISGVMHASPPVDSQHNDTYFVIAHFHYVLFGGSIFGLLAAAYFWFPKMSGKMMDEKLGKINFWTTFIGFNATFFPMHFLGLAGMPRRYYTYGEGSGWGFWNLIVSCGAFFLGASILLFLYNLGRSIVQGEPAGPNPWDAPTPEWMVPSPPPAYNFAQVPVIHHRDPIWWDKYGASDPHASESSTEYVADEAHLHELAVNESGIAERPVHLPNSSYYPAIAALGFFIAVLGLLFDDPKITIGLVHLPVLSILGTVIMVSSFYGWAFEPASDPVPAGAAH